MAVAVSENKFSMLICEIKNFLTGTNIFILLFMTFTKYMVYLIPVSFSAFVSTSYNIIKSSVVNIPPSFDKANEAADE